ncbi:hypothetical protein C8A00DRAFT_38976 [Chaetomidium leptoderma]|uniref:Uncharacterized protein n=1 Tax=Chaetomidium leptoderma TaxID=669021 RepID=A0AAN6VBS7_9PEZI|nr:hypothetical protein C8A00DRAFT_38976 [Chaetomidium leptoderma]
MASNPASSGNMPATEAELESGSLRAKADAHEAKANAATVETGRVRVQCNETVSALEAKQETLEAENRKLLVDLEISESRLETCKQLHEASKGQVARLSATLCEREADVGQLARDNASKDDTIRAGNERLQTVTEAHQSELVVVTSRLNDEVKQVSSLQQRISDRDEKMSVLEAASQDLSTSLAEVNGRFAVCQDEVHQLKASCNDAETRLANYFSNLVAVDIPGDGWLAFAHAAQATQLCPPDGAAPSIWTLLEAWDADDAEQGPTEALSLQQLTLELFAAFRTGTWSNRVLMQISVYTNVVAQTGSINVAVTRLVLGEAARAVQALDTEAVTATTAACGLGICQALVVLRTRWSELSVLPDPQSLAGHLTSLPIVDMMVTGLAPPTDCLRHGSISLVSRHHARVSFVVEGQTIRAVHKKRSGWKDSSTMSVRGPPGQDILITVDSDETHDWLFWNWLS